MLTLSIRNFKWYKGHKDKGINLSRTKDQQDGSVGKDAHHQA